MSRRGKHCYEPASRESEMLGATAVLVKVLRSNYETEKEALVQAGFSSIRNFCWSCTPCHDAKIWFMIRRRRIVSKPRSP